MIKTQTCTSPPQGWVTMVITITQLVESPTRPFVRRGGGGGKTPNGQVNKNLPICITI